MSRIINPRKKELKAIHDPISVAINNAQLTGEICEVEIPDTEEALEILTMRLKDAEIPLELIYIDSGVKRVYRVACKWEINLKDIVDDFEEILGHECEVEKNGKRKKNKNKNKSES